MALISAAVAATAAFAASGAGMTTALALSAAGAAGQAYFGMQASAASRRAEAARRDQMRLESLRKQRELIRQSQVANATALSRSVGQGAGTMGSNLMGAYGQTQGAYGRASNAEYQNLKIGERIFDANMDQATAQGWAQTFNGLGNFGNAWLNSADGMRKFGMAAPGSTQIPTQYPQANNPWFYGQGANPY